MVGTVTEKSPRPENISDEEILKNLLALNRERSGAVVGAEG